MDCEEWFDYCIKEGTSGDLIMDILKDWKKDREELIETICELRFENQFVED